MTWPCCAPPPRRYGIRCSSAPTPHGPCRSGSSCARVSARSDARASAACSRQPVASTLTAEHCGRSGCCRRAWRQPKTTAEAVAFAARLARLPDTARSVSRALSHGEHARLRYGARGSRRRSAGRLPARRRPRVADAAVVPPARRTRRRRRTECVDGDHGDPRRHLRPAPWWFARAGLRAPLGGSRAEQRRVRNPSGPPSARAVLPPGAQAGSLHGRQRGPARGDVVPRRGHADGRWLTDMQTLTYRFPAESDRAAAHAHRCRRVGRSGGAARRGAE